MKNKVGFTLIEIAVVLVVIGLVVGGILVGREMITSAQIQAQIMQIEKFNHAVKSFKLKYDQLPGDMHASDAATYGGFVTRSGNRGEGDGSGIIESEGDSTIWGIWQNSGESAVFWNDLDVANMTDCGCGYTSMAKTAWGVARTSTQLRTWAPSSKLGERGYVYQWSGGLNDNFFAVSMVNSVRGWLQESGPLFTVAQAHAIESKIDDGLPQTGNVTARYIKMSSVVWAAGGGANGTTGTTATAGSSTTCYDNNNVNGDIQRYSLTQSNGRNTNCALSFRIKQ